MTKITNAVLMVLFFNTAILMLIVNANLTEISGFLGSIFNGIYYDYSPKWYSTIGNQLVHTMLINAFMPIIYECIQCALSWFAIAKDSKQWCNCCGRKYLRYYSTQ